MGKQRRNGMKKVVLGVAVLLLVGGHLFSQETGFDTNYVWLSYDESGYPPITVDTLYPGDTLTIHVFAKPDTFEVAGLAVPLAYDTAVFELVDAAIDSSTFDGWMFIGVNDTIMEIDTLHPDSIVGKVMWYAVVVIPPAQPLPQHEVAHVGYGIFYVKDTVPGTEIDTCWYPPTNHIGFSNVEGTEEFVPNWLKPLFNPVGVEEGTSESYVLSLGDVRPNPFKAKTSISFTLPKTQDVELYVYNVSGQKVRTLVSGTLNAGTHSVTWDGRDDVGNRLPSGTYFYTLRTDNKEITRKVLLLR
ncbi:MAG: hypothetical protein DRQ04_04925 [Candidatus Hydrothermota bacterium]|nr:MAG: hypothetical protein DRQ04_04925 [Candidatus Hydrothermae bacterium]